MREHGSQDGAPRRHRKHRCAGERWPLTRDVEQAETVARGRVGARVMVTDHKRLRLSLGDNGGAIAGRVEAAVGQSAPRMAAVVPAQTGGHRAPPRPGFTAFSALSMLAHEMPSGQHAGHCLA